MLISTDGKDNSFELILDENGQMKVKSIGYGAHTKRFRKATNNFLKRYLERKSQGAKASHFNEKRGKLRWKF